MRRQTKDIAGVATFFRFDQGLSFQEYIASALQVELVRGPEKGGGIGSILYSDRSAVGGVVETFSYNPSVGHVVALTNSVATTTETNRFYFRCPSTVRRPSSSVPASISAGPP